MTHDQYTVVIFFFNCRNFLKTCGSQATRGQMHFALINSEIRRVYNTQEQFIEGTYFENSFFTLIYN